MFKTVLIICFSILILGCTTTGSNQTWKLPPKPNLQKVNIVVGKEDCRMSLEDGERLASNVEELKAYTEKLEVLVDEMVRYYK